MSVKKVTKLDLVDAIYSQVSCERKDVQQVVELLIEQLKVSLISGATIELRGFGTLEPRLRKGRAVAHNPRTGEELSVAPHYVAAFRSGKDLKQKLWNLSPSQVANETAASE